MSNNFSKQTLAPIVSMSLQNEILHLKLVRTPLNVLIRGF